MRRFIKVFKETWNESDLNDKIRFSFAVFWLIISLIVSCFAIWFVYLMVKVMLKYLAS